MTREEAIDIIKCLAWHTRPDEEDVERAIKALEQQPCEDYISRAKAIEEADKLCLETDYDNEQVIEMLNDLPPVTPKEKTGYRRLTNPEWIDFLSEQFDISRTSAKEMLHAMMSVKKEDNFKKQFNQGFSQDRKRGE